MFVVLVSLNFKTNFPLINPLIRAALGESGQLFSNSEIMQFFLLSKI
jgi:hypothetical protein